MRREKNREKTRIENYLDSDYDKLRDLHCTVIGLGTLGSKTSETLGKIGCDLNLIDRDFLESRNLDNQNYSKDEVGNLKAEIMKEKIEKISKDKNQDISCSPIDLNSNNIEREVKNTDVIIDSTDNLRTRLLLNDYSVKENVPLIIGMIGGAKGMTMTVEKGGPCLRCVLGEEPASEDTCDQLGVSPGIAEIISALQVKQIEKIVKGRPMKNLLNINLEKMSFDKLKTKNKKDCSTCNGKYKELSRIKEARTLCSEDSVQIYPRITEPEKVKEINPEVETYGDKIAILNKDNVRISVYSSGKAIVKGVESVEEARRKYDELLGGR